MDTQEIKIRAKKISELDNFNINDTDHSYIIIGYNDGESNKQNYKMNLTDLSNMLSGNQGATIDDQYLLNKINEFIANNQLNLPTTSGPQGPQGTQGPQGNGADISDIDLTEIQEQINALQELINRYHAVYSITYNLSNVIVTNSVNSINANNTVELRLSPVVGYDLPNSVNVTGCEYVYNKLNSTLILSNPVSDISITIVADSISDIYYFGFISINEDTSDKIEVEFQTRPNDDTEIIGIESVNIIDTSWMTSSNSCPFDINIAFQLPNTVIWGCESVMIVPAEFFNPSTSVFTDSVHSGKLKSMSSQFAFTFNIYKEITINGIRHYCVNIMDGMKGGDEYIIN